MLGIKLTHRPRAGRRGGGKIERLLLTVRDQFLVEITGEAAEAGRRGDQHRRAEPAVLRVGETIYHARVHSETGHPAPAVGRGLGRRRAAAADPAQLHQAFLWSERRTVRKTATVSLHGNTYQVDPSLTGRKVELIFDPFDLASIEVRWRAAPPGRPSRTSSTVTPTPRPAPSIPPRPPPRPASTTWE